MRPSLETTVNVGPPRMARPRKEGLEYFSLDCILDGKVEMVEAAHGNDGFAVLIKLWQAVYQTPEGRLDISVVLRRKTLAKRANMSEETWSAIVQTCVDAGLFDKKEYERGILTSSGVRKRLEKVTAERERGRNKKGRVFPGENSGETPEKPRKEKEKEKEKEYTPPLPPSHEGGGDGRGLTRAEESAGWTVETLPVLTAWTGTHSHRPARMIPTIVRQLLLPPGHPGGARLATELHGKVFCGFTVPQVVEGVRRLAQSGHRPSPENLIKHTAGLIKPRDANEGTVRLMTFDEAGAEARRAGIGDRWQRVMVMVRGPTPDGKPRWIYPAQAHLLPDGYTVDSVANGTAKHSNASVNENES